MKSQNDGSEKNSRILSAFLVMIGILIIVSLLPITASAGTYQDFQYTIDSNTREIKITGYIGSSADITIPTSINGYYVTAIGYCAFYKNDSIVNVRFEDDSRVKGFESFAFSLCSNLKTILLPESIRYFESDVFKNCINLLQISIPAGVTELTYSSFEGCRSLASVSLPSSLTKIGGRAFSGCSSLQDIELPAGLNVLGDDAFRESGLKSITLPRGITEIPRWCFQDCRLLETVNMSAYVKGIGMRAFSGCGSLTTINIPFDLETLGTDCFINCSSLSSLRFGNAIRSISGYDNVFAGCRRLTVEVIRGSLMETYCMNHDVPFFVYATDLSGCSISGIQDMTYNGRAQTQSITIAYGAETLEPNTDYTVTYANNVNAGTAKITIKGIGNYIGTIEKTFQILAADINDCKIKLSNDLLVYNADYQTPGVTVKYKGKKVSSSDYTLSYANNRYVGLASVNVSGTGNFINSKTLNFKIVPKGSKIRSLKGGTKSFTVTWKKNTIQTTGYQVQYSTDADFKTQKTITITSNTKNKLTVKKLKKKTTYYVRIRTYHLSGNQRFYSKWSDAKKVQTK